jgi:RHS repeat-associated protein
VRDRWHPGRNRKVKVEWDFEDRLVKVTKADGTVVENVYDVDGVLVRMSVNGVAMDLLVDTSGGLSHVVAEVDPSGAVSVLYVRAGDLLLEEVRGGVVKMYEADGLGSVRGLLDASGAKTDTYSYEAFGSTLSSTGSDANPYRFAGERLIDSVGFYQNRARWLDTRTGRFVSTDPLVGYAEEPQSLHRYLYGNASPLSYTDPTGWETVEGLSIAQLGQQIVSNVSRASLGAISRYTINRLGYTAVQLAVNYDTVLLYLELGGYAVGGAIAGAEAASEFLDTATQVWSNNTEPIPAGNVPRGIQLEKATQVNLGGNVSYIDGLYGDVGVSERTHDLASEGAYLESIRTDARKLSRATTTPITGVTTAGKAVEFVAGTVKRTALLVGIPEDHAYLMVRQSFIDGLQRIRDDFHTVIRVVPVRSWRAHIR